MKLSELLNKYIVIPPDYRTIIWYTADNTGNISLRWTDDGLEYTVECMDQDIELYEQDSCRGMFSIKDDDGELSSFLALEEAALND